MNLLTYEEAGGDETALALLQLSMYTLNPYCGFWFTLQTPEQQWPPQLLNLTRPIA